MISEKTKKIICLFLVSCIFVSLVSCGGRTTNSATNDDNQYDNENFVEDDSDIIDTQKNYITNETDRKSDMTTENESESETGYENLKKEIIIPNFIGQTYSYQMKIDLEKQGYNVLIEYEYGSEENAYTVIKQDPLESSKIVLVEGEQGCDITLTISLGEQTVKLFDYKLQDYRDVRTNLGELGLCCTLKFVKDEIIQEGRVIKTEPESGTLMSKNDIVTIYVSDGPDVQEVEVPDLLGKTVAEAENILNELKLNLCKVEYEDSDKPKGEIIEQRPEKSEKVTTGTDIHVVASKGPSTPSVVTLKNYKNNHVDAVMKDLDEIGLRYTIQDVHDENTPAGNIIRTIPAAGSDVTPSTDENEGSMITLYVSKNKN